MDETLRAPVRSEAVTLGSDFTATLKDNTAVWVGTSGNIVCQLNGDSGFQTFKNVPVGYFLGRFKIIRSTGNGTTAADLVLVTGIPKAG